MSTENIPKMDCPCPGHVQYTCTLNATGTGGTPAAARANLVVDAPGFNEINTFLANIAAKQNAAKCEGNVCECGKPKFSPLGTDPQGTGYLPWVVKRDPVTHRITEYTISWTMALQGTVTCECTQPRPKTTPEPLPPPED
jgi:hypothetical protein